jgi:hypothetical protein
LAGSFSDHECMREIGAAKVNRELNFNPVESPTRNTSRLGGETEIKEEESMGGFADWLPSRPVAKLFSFGTFQALLLVLTGLAALFFLGEAVRFVPVTGENIYPESAGVLAAQRWARGLPLYEDYRRAPYLITAFPPLWYALLAVAAKAGVSDLDSLTLLGRVWSLACLFGIAGLGYLWNRSLGFSFRRAFLASAFYFSFPILIPWAVTARPDLPALFLGFAALYCAGLRSSASSVALAGAVAALAFLAKHNAVAVPVALVLWLVWSKKWRHVGLFCAVWASVVGLTLLVFQFSSNGLLLLNLSGAKFGQFALTYVRDVLNRLLVTPGHGFAVALFAFGTFAVLGNWYKSDDRTRLLNIYLVVSFCLAVVGSAAAGATVNYYLEPALAMAVLLPIGLLRLEKAWRSDSPLASLVVVMLLAVLLPSLDVQRWNLMHEKPEDLRRVAALMENKHVLTDIPYLAARMPTPQSLDLASLINTERTGGWAAWSSAQLAQGLKARQFDLVILAEHVDDWPYNRAALYPRWPRLDSVMQAAIDQNYDFCFELDASYVYGPRSPGSNSSNCPSHQDYVVRIVGGTANNPRN